MIKEPASKRPSAKPLRDWLKFLRIPYIHLPLLLLVVLLAYSNIVNAPFHFDSNLNILENHIIRDISNIPAIFSGNEGPFASRPLMQATFALNYHFERFDTWSYHVVNLAVHITNVILLYLLIMTTGRHIGRDESDVRTAAFLASAVFAVHPIQTEAVTYVISRSVLLATTFYLAGMILFLKAVTTEKRRGIFVAGLFATSLMGMASRENFATFPIMLVLYDLFFISRFRKRELLGHWKIHLPVFLSLGYMAFIVLNSTYDTGTNFPDKGLPHRDYFLTQFNVHWTYLRLLVLPINQNLDYDYPAAGTLFEFPTVLSFLGYVALLVGSLVLAKRKPMAAFSVLWFLIILLPISFVVTMMDLRLDDVILEHRFYLPGTAFFALAGACAALALKRFRGERLRTAAVAVGVIVPLILAIATFNRNAVWQSEISLWKDAARKSPQKARPHYNLGTVYGMEGYFDMAIEEYHAAIRLKPDYVEAHNNLGIVYGSLGQLDMAIEKFQTAIELHPHHIKAHNNLGNAYFMKGQLDMAIEEYHVAIRLKPDNAIVHYNLGIVYEEKGLQEKAMEHYRTVIRLNPDHVEAHNNLGAVLADRRQLGEAIEHFQIAIKLDPEYAAAHNNLANAYQMMGLPNKAEEHFRQARELGFGR